MDAREKIEQLRALIALDPGDALTHYLLGAELLHAGEYAEAAAALARGLELNPKHTASQRLLGDAYRKSGQIEAARGAYRRAIELAEETGELQVAREARALLGKLG